MARLVRINDGACDGGLISQSLKIGPDGKEVFISNKPVIGCFMQVGSPRARSYSSQDY